jgi:hypothetical protein
MTGTTQSAALFGVATDYEYRGTHKRDRITVWSGPFYSTFEAEGVSLPNDAGYMLTTYNGDKVRVACPAPRTEDNFEDVDRLVSGALDAHFRVVGSRPVIELETANPDAHIALALHSVRNPVEEPMPRQPRNWKILRRVGIGVCILLVVADLTFTAIGVSSFWWWHR